MIKRVSQKDHPYIIKRKFICDICKRVDYFSAKSFNFCINIAFEAGWDSDEDGHDYCPICSNNIEYQI